MKRVGVKRENLQNQPEIWEKGTIETEYSKEETEKMTNIQIRMKQRTGDYLGSTKMKLWNTPTLSNISSSETEAE